MCLYPKLIKNPKYLPNKKNKGIIPKCEDERTRYVAIGCGHCIECMQQKARGWKVRLCEEFKVNKYSYFVTLTFSNEQLQKLCEEAQTKECNAIAGIAIRRFLERWRKKHGRSVRHWFVTELGHTNTERIHLHGIMFCEESMTNEQLESIWQYGWTDTGKYCNEKTINYITKYITKIDTDHKGYVPQVFCSAGIGKAFTDKYKRLHIYEYTKGNTNETYRLNNGSKLSLPIYYRNKLFTEEERELLWRDRLDKHTIYVRGIPCRKINTIEGRDRYEQVIRQAQKENEAMGYGSRSNEWKKKDYNITLKMLNSQKK